MRKGSAEAKAWGRKMKRLRGTRKGMKRKTARRAYTGLKKRRKKTKSTRKGQVLKGVFLGVKRLILRGISNQKKDKNHHVIVALSFNSFKLHPCKR